MTFRTSLTSPIRRWTWTAHSVVIVLGALMVTPAVPALAATSTLSSLQEITNFSLNTLWSVGIPVVGAIILIIGLVMALAGRIGLGLTILAVGGLIAWAGPQYLSYSAERGQANATIFAPGG